MFAALSERNYRLYAGGSILSNIGTWMQRVAQDWLVLQLSHGSGLAVGLTTALQFLPALMLPGPAGLAADRFDKRKLLRITQSWMGVCALVLGVLAIMGVARTWHVYLIALAFGVATTFDVPARQAFVSDVVGAAKLPNAIALNSASFNIARMAGPALGGLVIAAFGSGWAILTNGVSYVAFIVALGLMDTKLLHLTRRVSRGKGQVRQALTYLRHRADIVLILGVLFFAGTFGLNFQMMSALMATQTFHKGASQYGILGTIMALGSLAGALVGARRTTPPRVRFMVVTSVLFGLATMVSGMMPSYIAYAVSLPLIGITSMLCTNAANTIVQISVDPQLRGRVMAVYFLVMQGGKPVGSLLLGWFADVWTARTSVMISGGVVVVGALLCTLLVARRMGVSVAPSFSPRPHMELVRR